MTAYYNEIDPFAAAWLRNLISEGLIAKGEVDDRSIVDVRPSDLRSFNQCHFFAGIGVWSHVLRGAGVSDSANIWTGSCPCQPFSQAGAGAGFADERHLWPHFHWLISQCRPARIFGEQVASKDGLGWLDLVQTDLENEDYAFGAVDTCAAGFGAPHIRQRLYWVAKSNHTEWRADAAGGHERDGTHAGWSQGAGDIEGRGFAGQLADMRNTGLEGQDARAMGHELSTLERGGGVGQLDDSECDGRRARGHNHAEHDRIVTHSTGRVDRPGPTNGHWADADWLLCRDGKWRAVEPGTFPLAHGAAGRVGRLRAYGNAIVADQAQAFVKAALE